MQKCGVHEAGQGCAELVGAHGWPAPFLFANLFAWMVDVRSAFGGRRGGLGAVTGEMG